eukprot:gb/GECG01010387.1/.p1 GENE.gb/GECG01010387.1/~~gb/GECG01010387.1/.p1  ORF type:complete len:100 (+),score=8.80 gb/GECG01010387.1/:1-300(+)
MKCLLAIPASTATAESSFSIAGINYGKRRTRLSSERLESIMVVRYNRIGTLLDGEDRVEEEQYIAPADLQGLSGAFPPIEIYLGICMRPPLYTSPHRRI